MDGLLEAILVQERLRRRERRLRAAVSGVLGASVMLVAQAAWLPSAWPSIAAAVLLPLTVLLEAAASRARRAAAAAEITVIARAAGVDRKAGRPIDRQARTR